MPYILLYLLKFSLSLALLYMFYQLVLRRLTFYNWNRWCLLGYTVLSFAVPFINISNMLSDATSQSTQVIYFIPSLEQFTNTGITNEGSNSAGLNYWSVFLYILFAGILFMFLRLLVRLASFSNLLRQSRLISKNGVSLYEVDKPIIPFSFGNSIFLNPGQHNQKELEEIIRHEFVHVKQKHTIDILWAEFLCIINWYNPFAWLIRKAIRQNLEFIADDKVLQNGINKKEYQYLLLKVIGNNQFSIASQFNFSSLKKRIAMMNKIKSARVHLTKFAFLVPLIVVLLLAFRSSVPHELRPDVDVPSSALKDTVLPVNAQGYYVSITDNKGQCTVLVRDKNGKKVKKVDLLAWNQSAEEFVAKYGEIEPPHQPEECKLSNICDEFEITDTRAVMHLRSGKTEEYDLTNAVEKEKFEKKFGKIIPLTASVDAHMAIAAQEAGEPTTVIAPFSPTPKNLMFIGPSKTIITGDEDIIITITDKTTEKELEQFRQQLKAKGVELSVTEKIYHDGKLTSISGTLKANDSKSSFTAVDFRDVRLAVVNRDGKYYFKIVVNDPNHC